ncbi:MAG: VWA domain-containing protein [Acidobacteriota bacterium]
MTRRTILALALAGVTTLATPVTGAQSASAQNPVFASRIQAVLVDVLVTRGGKPVTGLTAADFEVRDNGVRQTVGLLNTENMPINAVLALDMSASTAGSRLADITAATNALLDGLRPIDRAALTTFSSVITPRVALTTNLSLIRTSMRAVVPAGETAILDGIYAALMATQAETGRSLLVVCTDGRDTSSWLDPDELLESARRANAVMAVVATGGARRWSVLTDLTNATGGATTEIESSRQIRNQFEAILREFRSRYVLTFVPTGVAEGGFHSLAVQVRGTRASVKARPGYIGGAARD